MKLSVLAFIALQFAHYLPFNSGEVFDYCQLLSVLLLLATVYSKVGFKCLREKRSVLALLIWLTTSFAMNAFDAETRWFHVADATLVVYVMGQLFFKPVERMSDELMDGQSYYLLSYPKEILGLLLSTVWLPFGNRMVVAGGYTHYVRRGRFSKRPFMDGLTGKRATPLLFDCRQYEVLFGSVRKALKCGC